MIVRPLAGGRRHRPGVPPAPHAPHGEEAALEEDPFDVVDPVIERAAQLAEEPDRLLGPHRGRGVVGRDVRLGQRRRSIGVDRVGRLQELPAESAVWTGELSGP